MKIDREMAEKIANQTRTNNNKKHQNNKKVFRRRRKTLINQTITNEPNKQTDAFATWWIILPVSNN